MKTLSVTSPRPRTAAVAASLPWLSRCAAPKAHALRLLEARRRHLLERAPAGRHRWRLRTLCGRRSRALTGGRSSLSSSCLPGGRVGDAAHMFMYKGMLVARDNDSYMASSLKP